VQRGQMLARLKEEREAWTKVYMNVTVFTLKQLSRKVFISNGPELKHDFGLKHEIKSSRHKTEITNRIENRPYKPSHLISFSNPLHALSWYLHETRAMLANRVVHSIVGRERA
jgi:hypothetical protein